MLRKVCLLISPDLTDSVFSTSLASFPIHTNTWEMKSGVRDMYMLTHESQKISLNIKDCQRQLLWILRIILKNVIKRDNSLTWSQTSSNMTSSSARSSWLNSPGTSSICCLKKWIVSCQTIFCLYVVVSERLAQKVNVLYFLQCLPCKITT